MLVGVAPLHLSFPPSGTYLGILQYKQAKLRKHLQHSAQYVVIEIESFFSMLFINLNFLLGNEKQKKICNNLQLNLSNQYLPHTYF